MTNQVLITSNTLNFGGAEVQRILLANGFVKRGFKVGVVVLQSMGPLALRLAPEVAVKCLKNGRMRSVLSAATSPRGSAIISGTTQTEVVHCFLTKIFLRKTTWIVAAHNFTVPGKESYPKLVQKLVRFADFQVCLSRHQADCLIKTDGFVQSKVKIIPNGIEVHKFHKIKPIEGSRTIHMGFIGRLDRIKGLDVLLDVLLELNFKNWRLIVSGYGAESKLFDSKKYSSISDKIDFVGPRDAVQTLEKIDFLVLPSRNEAYPLVVLEALVAGVPVLASRVGAVEQICEGKAGLIFEPESESSLFRVLNEMMSEINKLKRKALSQKDENCRQFSSETMVESYCKLLSKTQPKK